MPTDRVDPEAAIHALSRVGVDFSVDKNFLVEWLGNPEFTPYPALADALLQLLGVRALRLPVFIDVIVFNYEHSAGNASPRRIEDVDLGMLKAAILESFNERYGEENSEFDSLLKPLDLHTFALTVEGTSSIINDGTILVTTDNPLVQTNLRLIDVHSEAAQAMVPQEIHRERNGWRFTNGDVKFSVSGGESDAEVRPVRAGSLNDDVYAWPVADGTFTSGSEVTLQGRVRVGYRPIDVKLLVEGRRGYAANTGKSMRIALDPKVLLVPVEVVRFFSDQIPVAGISMFQQMALWDQLPIISDTTNFRVTEGSELKSAERSWDIWPIADARGLYLQDGWVSPDSIWGKADVRFRLVNYIDIKTDNDHTNPRPGQGADDAQLRQNNTTLNEHPRHIKDKRVLKVIFMNRIAPPNAPEIGRALIRNDCIGLSVGTADRFATIAHEIGHLITGSDKHRNDLPDNVLADPGPGVSVTEEQIAKARAWAQNFSEFWQH